MNIKDLDLSVLSHFVDYDGHETIRRIEDAETGLLAFIGVHNGNLGPALGGCRMFAYDSEEDAIRDVLRLSRGMTYKNALAGLPLGGGKSVIIGDPRKLKTEALISAVGRAVESLGGRYITAEDSGTNEHDMITMAKETSYVVGLPSAADSVGGDPSPVTAYGVFKGLKACVARRYGSDSVKGLKVAVQGLGAVGYALCQYLHGEGAILTVTDVREESLSRARSEMPGLTVVAPDDIFAVEANVFAPCALGAQINDQTVPQLKVDIVAGAANNQLATPAHGHQLADKGILYAPDYVINAGGVICVAYEYCQRIGKNPFSHDITRANMMAHVDKIGTTLETIFNIADARQITTAQAADERAEAIFRAPKKAVAQG
ncbi:MAG: amino acid dehydrogenase [Alphaproteobacteria bacterium]|nr:amino acid dehydrogenase [Alphaproteobacteria bacterium]